MRTLHVIALGGTIASSTSPAPTDSADSTGRTGPTSSTDRTDSTGPTSSTGPANNTDRTDRTGPTAPARGVAPTVTAEEITAAARLDTLPGGAPQVSAEQLAQVGSGSIDFGILFSTVLAARRAAEHGADGIVLTQGTDTLEDSAFALSLLNDSGIPIVLTGAMRNPTLPGADGPANVRAAALTALAPEAAGLRAALVFADEVHDPLFVRKAHTSHVSPFTSGPVVGALGWVAEDRVRLPHLPAPRTLPVGLAVPRGSGADAAPDTAHAPNLDFPRVAHIDVGFDDGLELLATLPEAGYSGAVLAGVGGGHVAARAVEAVEALAVRMPVVLASRTGAGATLEDTYGYPGAEIDLLSRGLLPAGLLDARKARIALTLALACGVDPAEVLAAFR